MFKTCPKRKKTKIISEYRYDKRAKDWLFYICNSCKTRYDYQRYIKKVILIWIAKAEQWTCDSIPYIIYFWSIIGFMILAYVIYYLIW